MTSIAAKTPFLDALPRSATLCDARTCVELTRVGLASDVGRAARDIRARGVGLGTKVVLCLGDPLKLLTTMFACWSVGATAVIVPLGLTQPERQTVAAWIKPALWCDDDQWTSADVSTVTPDTPIGLDDTALVLMTSGTTGQPKGVELTLRSLMARCALNLAHIGTVDLSETLCLLPLQFGHGLIGNVLTPLWAGGRVHLWPSPAVPEWQAVAAYLDTAQITFLSSVPVHWRMLMRCPRPVRNSLMRVHIGSAPLSLDTWAEVVDWTGTENVWNMFGMTECANWFSGARFSADAADGLIGRAWGGSAAVAMEDGAIHANGRGELLIQSPSMMSGYLDDSDRTHAAFFGQWLRTGDVAEMADDGAIRLTGRLKTEINRAGLKVYPEEIDLVLERHDAVAEACAFALPDPVGGETVGAAVVVQGDAGVSANELLSWLRGQIRPEALPTRLWIMETLPRSNRGKLLRDKVRDAALGAGQ